MRTCAGGGQLDKSSDDFLYERVRRIHTGQIIQSPEKQFYCEEKEE